MSGDLAVSRRWMADGTALFINAAAALDLGLWAGSSGLPGWTRSHLVAHVAANADAIGNLVRWAATGEKTPMYASVTERADAIERGSRLAPAMLLMWLRSSADQLEAAMTALTGEQWQQLVVTAQGRTVPASETPWMRAREVMVHAVDLAAGVSFTDLPQDFLAALKADIATKRGEIPDVTGSPAEIVAYLAGRPAAGVTGRGGSSAPVLGPWL